MTEATETEPLLSIEEANALVVEHHGWAESIARSVARSWNLDWRQDGLDGAAMEALIFCSRRYDPKRGVPFKGYARRRIHEASTEAARKSRGWTKTASTSSKTEQRAREVSVELYTIFPELREGELPGGEEGRYPRDDGEMRGAIRQLLMGASLIAAREGISGDPSPEESMDYKKMVTVMSSMEPVHQLLLYKVYWEGSSLRQVAADWETDGLNVIREHKILMMFLHKRLAAAKASLAPPKIRPGLKEMAKKMKEEKKRGPFTEIAQKGEQKLKQGGILR